jgi:malonyl CoA-acyl carrier protein transacylase
LFKDIGVSALIHDLDGPRTAQQELFYDLEDAAAMLGWSVVELTAMAASGKTPDEVATLVKVCELLTAQQQKLEAYSDEVKQQRIIRHEAV